ncbi:MAG: family 43 glycosylhydrolase [Pseudomonadota bacterium]|nr:family 43 glycosylhydrolase [Pseudomonadota bacterium]
MFETLADGYWMSDDLAHWTFITPSKWPTSGVVAPAVWSDGQRLYMLPATTAPTAIFVSVHPETGTLDYLTRRMPDLPNALAQGQDEKAFPGKIPPGPWDPALFKDDDGRWYLYWNSSNVWPLYGIELDPAKKLAYIGQPQPLLTLHPDVHGWERFGQDHSGTLPNGTPIAPFVEGAWMTKIGPRYYLQYGAPGTEYNAYANGTYVGDKPLGPFTYAPWNPIAYKPGGFVQGAGHGSTFSDRFGNLWNSGTRGSATTGPSSGASTCSLAAVGPTGRSAFQPASPTSRTIRRPAGSTIPRACSPAGCCCPTASRSSPPRPWARSPPTA